MTVKKVNPQIEKQAKSLAADNRQAQPDITRILWFPDDTEVRLVELTEQIPANEDDELHPFYFRASPKDDLPFPSAMVMIRPDEINTTKPPTGWGSWTDAVEL